MVTCTSIQSPFWTDSTQETETAELAPLTSASRHALAFERLDETATESNAFFHTTSYTPILNALILKKDHRDSWANRNLRLSDIDTTKP